MDILNDGGNMAIRNGDKVRFKGENGEVRGEVLTISRKGPNKGQALLAIPGLKFSSWVNVGQLSKV